MKTLIVFQSKHGSTEKCVELLKEKLQGEVVLANMAKGPAPSIEEFDQVIIGGPIYAGQLPKGVKAYCSHPQVQGSNVKLGLFVCGMLSGEKAEQELNAAFPEVLVKKAVSKQFFGGAFYLNRMNFIEKGIVKMVTKSEGGLDFQEGPGGKFIERFELGNIQKLAKTMGGR